MKSIKQYVLACVAIFGLSACPDSPDEQAYTQNITLPSDASERLVTIEKLSSSIKTVENSASWLIVEQQFYSSGSPQIKLRSTANTDKEDRKCNVSIIATSGDKVILNITQQGAEKNSDGSGIDDLHGIQTDKPSYSKQE